MKRESEFTRSTSETHITGKLDLSGEGKAEVQTGIGFLDHMLELWAFHSGFNLNLSCKGDLHVCAHHSIEDIAITLGSAVFNALGDRKGIARYATFFMPMDETLTRTIVDISGRAYHVFKGDFDTETIGEYPVEMTKHFFYSFATNAKLTLHQEVLYGENDHHRVESLFKGFGRALAEAVSITSDRIPSTKGVL